MSWRERADEALLVGMPARGRVLIEVLLLAALVLGGHAEASAPWLGVSVVALELAIAIGLLRPWSGAHRTVGRRVLVTVVAIVTVLAPVLVDSPAGPSRRLGVELVPADAGGSRGYAEVKSVTPGAPAAGTLRPGDRIRAVGGAPLIEADPPAELARRIQSDSLPEDTVLTVERDGATVAVPVHVPRSGALARRLGAANSMAKDHVIVATALRDLVLIAFLFALVRVDGQPLTALGIAREGARRELAAAVPALGGVFAVQVAAAIPIALIGTLIHVGEREATTRIDTLSHLSAQMNGPEFLLALVVAAAFEEVAFRAFLTPRVRWLGGSWVLSTVVVSALFGLGHGYEGTIAMLQTAILGVYFTAVLLVRRRLLAGAISHAAFNALMFVLVRVVARSGAIDALKSLAPH